MLFFDATRRRVIGPTCGGVAIALVVPSATVGAAAGGVVVRSIDSESKVDDERAPIVDDQPVQFADGAHRIVDLVVGDKEAAARRRNAARSDCAEARHDVRIGPPNDPERPCRLRLFGDARSVKQVVRAHTQRAREERKRTSTWRSRWGENEREKRATAFCDRATSSNSIASTSWSNQRLRSLQNERRASTSRTTASAASMRTNDTTTACGFWRVTSRLSGWRTGPNCLIVASSAVMNLSFNADSCASALRRQQMNKRCDLIGFGISLLCNLHSIHTPQTLQSEPPLWFTRSRIIQVQSGSCTKSSRLNAFSHFEQPIRPAIANELGDVVGCGDESSGCAIDNRVGTGAPDRRRQLPLAFGSSA